MAPTTRAGAARAESSEDSMAAPTATRSSRRLAGGGARGAPAPATRAASATQRGRPAAATRGGRGRPTTTRRAATAAVPIVGGRQNQMAGRATRVRDAGARGGGMATRGIRRPVIATMGHSYRTGRQSGGGQSGGGMAAGVIELSSDEEGEDVDDEDEEEDEDDRARRMRRMEREVIEVIEDIEDMLFDEEISDDDEEFELNEERDDAEARKIEEKLRENEDREEKANKTALRTDMFGACTVCAVDEVIDPVGCIHCCNLIGCRKCANRWYRTSKKIADDKIANCPFCRHQWPGDVPEVGDQLDLVRPA